MDQHNAAVRSISSTVKSFHERNLPFRIYHGSTNSTRPVARRRDNIVDISSLHNVLSINPEKMTALVEPNVPMDRLIEATLAEGVVPPVVMEFAGITVGGGFAGEAGESSSFKHGLFDSTIVRIEMVLANGEVVDASRTERPDLFYAAAGSFGTLGVTTLLEIQLIPAKKFVEVRYETLNSLSDAVQRIEKLRGDTSLDYLDGIAFSPSLVVVMAGRLSDSPPSTDTPIRHFTRPRDQVFPRHVEKMAQKSKSGEPWTDLIPLGDYLLRYDRGAFWGAIHAFNYFHLPYNRTTRWVLSNWIKPRIMYPALHKSGISDRYVIQDLSVPAESALALLDFLKEEVLIWPLWLCPLKIENTEGSLHTRTAAFLDSNKSSSEKEKWLNVGVWGRVPRNHSPESINRLIEQKVKELRGIKILYAHVHYSEKEFWEIYDRKWYEELREKYDATSLPTVYEKVRVDKKQDERRGARARLAHAFWSIWPLSAVYGIVCAGLFKDIGRDWLLSK